MKTNDPVQEIQDKVDEAWALNERDGFGQPDALIALKNLLKLVRAYEEALKLVRAYEEAILIVSDSDRVKEYMAGLKSQIFNNKGESDV